MSQYPPGGPGAPPPPPYYGHVPPPAPGAYAYVPAPIVVPVAQPPYPPAQPTYVTNHYYPSQPPETVHVVNHPPVQAPVHDPIDWVPCTPSAAPSFAHRSVVAGKEGWDNSDLWVIRAHHSGDLIPGKLAVKHRAAYIPYSGKEVPVHNFELLCAPSNQLRWLGSSNGQVPPGAIVAGNTQNGEPLYVGRVRYMKSLTPGKIHPSHGCLYISHGGQEIPQRTYEVLCKVVG